MTVGINATALDADRVRDELADSLEEIRRRLAPAQLRNSLVGAVDRHPVSFVAGTVGFAAAVTGVALLSARTVRHG